MKKIFLLLIVFVLAVSCAPKKHYKNYKTTDIKKPWSWGKLQTIYVFADDDIWKIIKKPLKKVLEVEYYTTENEKYFEIKRASFTDLKEFYKYNNLIFLADINSKNDVSEYVKSVMKKELIDEVSKKKKAIYAVNNLWARDQVVAFVLGADKKNLFKEILGKRYKLFGIFKDKLYARIKEKVYKRELYPEKSFEKLPWRMDITKNYVLYKEDSNFTSFLNRIITKPDKYVSVYFEKMPKEQFGKSWILKTRDKIGEKYYEGDKIDSLSLSIFGKYKISKYKCIKISGRWQNKKYFVGGAFQCFGLYDDKSQTAYLIDNSVYYPDGKKLLSLIELEVISDTFIIKK